VCTLIEIEEGNYDNEEVSDNETIDIDLMASDDEEDKESLWMKKIGPSLRMR